MKKLTAILLILAMLVPLSTAVAADEMSAKPTVEEILNEYHQKAFDEKCSNKSAASTWSIRSDEGQTLEQETVDALNDAGYEAYHLTADNYDDLEAKMNTSFADMGLDPDGSYIIAIDEGQTVSSNARISPEIDLEGPGNNGGYPSTYTYNGVTYNVRYLTVTPTNDENLEDYMKEYVPLDGIVNDFWVELGEYTIVAGIDRATGIPIGSVGSLIWTLINDEPTISFDESHLVVEITTRWTREFIQVQDIHYGAWLNRQCSEFAISNVEFDGEIIDESTGKVKEKLLVTKQFMTYSPDYLDINSRLYYGLAAHSYGGISHDKASISLYLDGVNLSGELYHKFLFTQWSPAL